MEGRDKMMITVTWYGSDYTEPSGFSSMHIEQHNLSSNASSIGIHSISELVRAAIKDYEENKKEMEEKKIQEKESEAGTE